MKPHPSAALALVVWVLTAAAACLHAEPGFFLKEMPDLDVKIEEKLASADEAKQIKQLIQELAATDAPDIGYSASLAGDAFGPLPELNYRGTENVTNHGLKHSYTLERLVAFGPKALPFLLDALDDKTPTKLKLHSVCDYHKSSAGPSVPEACTLFTSFTFQTLDCPVVPAREILYNPLNTAEARALKTADVIRMTGVGDVLGDCTAKLATEHIKDKIEYTVAVGDLCLVAVGQITNRPYPAARYQGTGHTYINSSAHDPEIAKAVRSVWPKKTYRRQLFDSLMIDFHTRGGDDRGGTSRLQIGAATRLMYYFPDEAGPVVARRLHGLNVDSEIHMRQREGSEANGIWAPDLLKAVAFTENKDVRGELLDIFRRTADQEIALAVLPGIDKEREPEVLAKLELFMRLLPKQEKRLYGDGYQLMKAVAKYLGIDRLEVFDKYLNKASAQRRTTVCRVLRDAEVRFLAKDLLTPWLEDKTEAFTAKDDWDGFALGLSGKRRMCDEAAYALARNFDSLSFDPAAKEADRDKQIETIRKQLSPHSKEREDDQAHQPKDGKVKEVQGLTNNEETLLRKLVYEDGLGTSIPLRGPWAGHRILVVTNSLIALHKRKRVATLRLLLDVVKGGRPNDVLTAAGFAVALEEDPLEAEVFANYPPDAVDDNPKEPELSGRRRLIECVQQMLTIAERQHGAEARDDRLDAVDKLKGLRQLGIGDTKVIVQSKNPLKGEQTALTVKEEAAVRSSVYNGAIVSSVPDEGPWARLPVLAVPEELKTIYARKSEATLALLLDIVKGGSPQDARLAGGFAVSLAMNPFLGYQECQVSEATFDTLIDTQKKTPRQMMVEEMKDIIKKLAEKK